MESFGFLAGGPSAEDEGLTTEDEGLFFFFSHAEASMARDVLGRMKREAEVRSRAAVCFALMVL